MSNLKPKEESKIIILFVIFSIAYEQSLSLFNNCLAFQQLNGFFNIVFFYNNQIPFKQLNKTIRQCRLYSTVCKCIQHLTSVLKQLRIGFHQLAKHFNIFKTIKPYFFHILTFFLTLRTI